jgi:lysophospholipase L1-like esterase
MRPRESARRLGLVVAGLVAGLVLLEALLRLGALVAPRLLARAVAPAAGEEIRILCVGDSHTFGVLVRPEEAYPERLEHHLRARGLPVSVFNLGIPGQNSRQVESRLARDLVRYRPRLVLVLVGLNNYWNLTEREQPARWRIPELRLVRFARLFWLARRQRVEIEGRRPDLELIEDVRGKGARWVVGTDEERETIAMQKGAADLDLAEVERVTTEDLAAIVAIARGHGAVPVLLSYPIQMADNAKAVNRAIARAAEDTTALRLDTRAVMIRLFDEGRRGLFFGDLHPTAPLYDEIARDAARALVEAGLLPASSPPG